MNGPSLTDILITTLPMLLLVGVWHIFVRTTNRGTAPFQQTVLDEMKRQTAIQERIAVALEKRAGS